VKKIVAIDFGFGFTKVKTEEELFRFPSYIGHFDNKSEELRNRVKFGGQEYVIGEDVVYLSQKLNIAGIKELIENYPIFIKGILEKLSIKAPDAYIITGIPPIYKDQRDKILKIFADLEVEGEVVSQTTGIFADSMRDIKGDVVLVLDPGYNTFDYLVLSRDSDSWRRVRSGTLAGQGVNKAVEFFKEAIDDTKIKNQPTNALLKAFENGKILIGGEYEDVQAAKAQAIDNYIGLISGRLATELGDDLVSNIEETILGGGGANFIDPTKLGFRNAKKPDAPEFAQVRGYFLMAKDMLDGEKN